MNFSSFRFQVSSLIPQKVSSLILLLSLLLLPLAVAADLVIDADRQLGLAHDAMDRGDFGMAAIEYERFVYFFPEDERIGQTLLAIGQVHFNIGDYDRAATAFQRLIDSPHGRDPVAGSPGARAWEMLSRCREAQGNRVQAIVDMQNLIVSTTDSQVIDQARYRIGWLYLEDGAVAPAQDQFGKVSLPNIHAFRIDDLNQAMAGFDDLPAKNPALAGVLGLVPGAGYLYCERPNDALVAFVLNVALAIATIEAFDEDLEAVGALTGLVGLGFYTGSIHGSVNAARKYNTAKAKGFIEQLRQRFKIEVAFTGSSAALVAGAQW